ncbi:MAG TPA: GNAT family N-acetyltransferase [Streptosporangiaceae bacterium]|jgi:GNAT superfamily N-acetyltransferase
MSVTVRPARPGDGAGIAHVWASAADYYAALDPEHFRIPRGQGVAEHWDALLGREDEASLRLVAEVDDAVAGWLSAHIEPPEDEAEAQITREQSWTRLTVDALIVDHQRWRHGAGTALLAAAEAWGRRHGAQVARLDTYADSPVSVPFYEERMGYRRRSIVFQKRL